MADLPEYKNRVAIEPGQVSTGWSQTLGDSAKSLAVIGELGMQVAQQSANNLAKEVGYQAGKTPGLELLPSFTETDAEFAQAYHQQEYNIAKNNASIFLEKAAFDAAKNPSAQSIAMFEEQTKEYLHNNIESLSTNTKRELMPKLEQAFIQSKLNLEGAVFKKAQQFQQENFKTGINDAVKDINNLVGEYDIAGAKSVIAQKKAELNSAWVKSIYSDGVRKEIAQSLD